MLTSRLKKLITRFFRIIFKIWMRSAQVVGSIVLFFIIIGLIGLSSDMSQTTHGGKIVKVGSDDQVAVVYLFGEIVEVSQIGGLGVDPQVIAVDKIIELLDYLESKSEVKAVVLNINSPGGAVVASDMLYQRIKTLSGTKPVVARLSDVAASGGYYIAAAADQVIANPATITGSVGVIAQFLQADVLLGRIGVEFNTFKSGQFKDIGNLSRQISPEEKDIVQSIVDDSFTQFLNVVQTERELDDDQLTEIDDGRILSGRQAKEAGLVDLLGNLDLAVKEASSLASISNPTIVEYKQTSFLASLFSSQLNLSPWKAVSQVIPLRSAGLYYLMEW